jgi:hypothetical protein
MKMLFLVPLFAIGLTTIIDYFLPEMTKRKRIILFCVIAFLSSLLGVFIVLFMFKFST